MAREKTKIQKLKEQYYQTDSIVGKLAILRDLKNNKKRFALIIPMDNNNYCLMGVRKDNGKLTFIGGGINDDETPEQGALRELREEINVQLMNGDLTFEKSVIQDDREIYIYTYIDKDLSGTAGTDVDDEFSELQMLHSKAIVNCNLTIPLQYECNINVGVQFLKEKYSDLVQKDSIVFDDAIAIIKDRYKKAKSVKEKLALIKRLKELESEQVKEKAEVKTKGYNFKSAFSKGSDLLKDSTTTLSDFDFFDSAFLSDLKIGLEQQDKYALKLDDLVNNTIDLFSNLRLSSIDLDGAKEQSLGELIENLFLNHSNKTKKDKSIKRLQQLIDTDFNIKTMFKEIVSKLKNKNTDLTEQSLFDL